MNPSRRLFLKGALAITAAVVAPIEIAAAALPRIWGDGVHDDTAGLQALFDGKPVQIENESVRSNGNLVELGAGTFLLTAPLELRHSNIMITGGTIESDASPVLRVTGKAKSCTLEHFTIRSRGKGPGVFIEDRGGLHDKITFDGLSTVAFDMKEAR